MKSHLPPKLNVSQKCPDYGESLCAEFQLAFNEWYDEVFKDVMTVYGKPGVSNWCLNRRDERNHSVISSNFINDTHTAILISIQPIKTGSADDLLKEFVHIWDADNLSNEAFRPTINKVRKYLEGK